MSYHRKPLSEPARNDPDWELVKGNPTFCGGFPNLDLIVEDKSDKYSRAMIESEIGDDYEIMDAAVEPEVRVTERSHVKQAAAVAKEETTGETTTKANEADGAAQDDGERRPLYLHPWRWTEVKIPKGRTWYMSAVSAGDRRELNKSEVKTVGRAILKRAHDKYIEAKPGHVKEKYREEHEWLGMRFQEMGHINGMMYDLDA